MSEIGSDTQPGSPRSPLEEAESLRHNPDALIALMLGEASSKIIAFMSRFPSEVMAERVGNYTVRSLRIDCSAPLAPAYGMYINGAHHIMNGIEVKDVIPREPTVLDIGDVVRDEAVVNRWARLSRPEGEPFGVSGVSRVLSGGRVEQWKALTTVITGSRSRPEAELWAETAENGQARSAVRISEESPEQDFSAHFFAIQRGVGRSLTKRVKASS